jgi:hypothetical protein
MSSTAVILGRLGVVCIAALVLSSAAPAQNTTASCTFKLFQLNPSDPSNPTISAVSSVNKWGTTVGDTIDSGGFVRYSGGFVKYFPLGVYGTYFNARNDSGVTVGYYTDGSYHDNGFMLQGSTVTLISDPAGSRTQPTGINKWNSIVGQYISPGHGDIWTGFKRYSNGSFIDLLYPQSASTYPNAINDSGAVVGYYYDLKYVKHGFFYYSGKWATLDYSGSETVLLGISNSGVILGVGGSGFFLYANDAFELLPSAPNASSTSYNGMSLGGLLTGKARDSVGQHGFVATCQ